MMTSLEGQVGGFLLHNLLGAVAQCTFTSFDTADVPAEDADVRDLIKRKGWRVKHYAMDEQRRLAACMSLSVNLPVDHVWRHVQHREENGAALQDLCCPKLNFFTQAGRSYYKMVAALVSQGPLSPLFWHFGHEGHADHAGLLRAARGAILQKAAHLWFRLEVPLVDFPFKLCAVVDARLTTAEQQAVLSEFYQTPLCCLDAHFSRKAALLLLQPATHFDSLL
jgi:hypothetical protein